MPDADTPSRLDSDADVRLYVSRRVVFVVGLMGVVVFPAAGTLCVWAALANSDGSFREPARSAVISGVGFLGATLMSIHELVSSRRMRLFVSPGAVRMIGAFTDRSVVFAEATRVQWRWRPAGGSLVLHAPSGRLVINFGAWDRGVDLVGFFRRSLPESVQEGHQQFEARVMAVRRPVIVPERTSVYLSAGSLLAAVLAWIMRDVSWVRPGMLIPLLFCPTIASVAILDCVRRPTGGRALTAAMAVAGLACLLLTVWPK